jgi:long-chain acyl-CoA synthetase
MKGYYKDPDATEECLREGWLRTGDLGSLDASGRLRVMGRAKDTVVLSTGKKVSSSHVEQVLSRCAVIQSIVVVGNHRKFLTAVIVPHRDQLERFAAGKNVPLDAALPEINPEMASWITEEIAKTSSELAEHERIKRFCLLPEEVLTDPEIITPTQKLRRSAFEAKYRRWIDRMYADPVPFWITGLAMSAASTQPPARFAGTL